MPHATSGSGIYNHLENDMDTDEMLKWLFRNCDAEKLGYEDYTAITQYAERAGPHFDTSVLLPASLDHIRNIFKQHGV